MRGAPLLGVGRVALKPALLNGAWMYGIGRIGTLEHWRSILLVQRMESLLVQAVGEGVESEWE